MGSGVSSRPDAPGPCFSLSAAGFGHSGAPTGRSRWLPSRTRPPANSAFLPRREPGDSNSQGLIMPFPHFPSSGIRVNGLRFPAAPIFS